MLNSILENILVANKRCDNNAPPRHYRENLHLIENCFAIKRNENRLSVRKVEKFGLDDEFFQQLRTFLASPMVSYQAIC